MDSKKNQRKNIGRKGQFQISLTVITALVVAVFVLFFGVISYNSISDAKCTTELAKFKVDFESLLDSGSRMSVGMALQSLEVPCGSDRVMFFDDDSGVLFDGFKHVPIIDNALHSLSAGNVFLMKEGDVMDIMHFPNLSIKVPYFMCGNIIDNKLDFYLETTKSGIDIREKNYEMSCTYDYVLPIELTAEDALSVIYSIFEQDKGILNQTIVDPLGVGMTRTVSYDGNWTIINISKQFGNFSYYESIPKCMMESISGWNASGLLDIEGNFTSVADDPLIMWKFEKPNATESVVYKIKGLIEPDCLRGHSPGLFGLGFAEETFPEGVPLTHKNDVMKQRIESGTESTVVFDEEILPYIEEQTSQKIVDLKMELFHIKANINNISGIGSGVKSGLLAGFDSLVSSLENGPVEIESRIENIKKWFNAAGLIVGDYLTSDIESMIYQATYEVIATSVELEIQSSEIFNCSDDDSLNLIDFSGKCEDNIGENPDICVGNDEVSQAFCNTVTNLCEYSSTLSSCGTSEICVSGECVSNLTSCSVGAGLRVKNIEQNTGFEHDIYFDNVNLFLFNKSEHDVEVSVPRFMQGTEFVIRVDDITHSESYFTGDPTRNSIINQDYTNFIYLGDDKWLLGFEDWTDFDYNDVIISIEGVNVIRNAIPVNNGPVQLETSAISIEEGNSGREYIKISGGAKPYSVTQTSSSVLSIDIHDEDKLKIKGENSGSSMVTVTDDNGDSAEIEVNVVEEGDHFKGGYIVYALNDEEDTDGACFSNGEYFKNYCEGGQLVEYYCDSSEGCKPNYYYCGQDGKICSEGACVEQEEGCLVAVDGSGVLSCYEDGELDKVQECREDKGFIKVKEPHCNKKGECKYYREEKFQLSSYECNFATMEAEPRGCVENWVCTNSCDVDSIGESVGQDCQDVNSCGTSITSDPQECTCYYSYYTGNIGCY